MRRLVILLSLAGCHEAPAPPGPKTANDVTAQVVINDAGEKTVVSPAPAVATPAVASPAKPKPTKIKIVVRSSPLKSLVTWGKKKKLGETPVTLERPRDSGPIDLIVRYEGYFPVHTRAYTFRNETLYVKLTKVQDRMTLFGARMELEPSPSPAPALPQ